MPFFRVGRIALRQRELGGRRRSSRMTRVSIWDHCPGHWHVACTLRFKSPHAAHHARVVRRPIFVVADQRDAQLRFLVIGGGLARGPGLRELQKTASRKARFNFNCARKLCTPDLGQLRLFASLPARELKRTGFHLSDFARTLFAHLHALREVLLVHTRCGDVWAFLRSPRSRCG